MAFEVFISYAHEDLSYLKELEKHLANLKRQNIIASWYDGDITPGTEWESQMMERLKNSQIILLLVSADFINSDFCYGIEMEKALARHDANQVRVIPIILRPVDWKGAPFAKIQALPSGAKPVTRWPTHDDAFLDVVQGIRRAIDYLTRKGKTSNPELAHRMFQAPQRWAGRRCQSGISPTREICSSQAAKTYSKTFSRRSKRAKRQL